MTAAAATPLKGSVRGIIFHDVCEESKLDDLRGILDASELSQFSSMPRPSTFALRILRLLKPSIQFCSAAENKSNPRSNITTMGS